MAKRRKDGFKFMDKVRKVIGEVLRRGVEKRDEHQKNKELIHGYSHETHDVVTGKLREYDY